MINYDSFRTPTNRMRIFFLSSILLFAVSTTIFSQDVNDLDLKVLFTNELHEDNKLWQSNIKFAPNGKYFLVNNREEIAVIDSKKFRVKSRVHLQLRLLSSARPQRLSRFENQMEKFWRSLWTSFRVQIVNTSKLKRSKQWCIGNKFRNFFISRRRFYGLFLDASIKLT